MWAKTTVKNLQQEQHSQYSPTNGSEEAGVYADLVNIDQLGCIYIFKK